MKSESYLCRALTDDVACRPRSIAPLRSTLDLEDDVPDLRLTSGLLQGKAGISIEPLLAGRAGESRLSLLEPRVLAVLILDVADLIVVERFVETLLEAGLDLGYLLPFNYHIENVLDLAIKILGCSDHDDIFERCWSPPVMFTTGCRAVWKTAGSTCCALAGSQAVYRDTEGLM